MKDPIVEEIRSFRDAHSKKFNYDLDAICEDLKTHQKNAGFPLVKLKPKQLSRKMVKRKSAFSK
jgi:hypothetical protein